MAYSPPPGPDYGPQGQTYPPYQQPYWGHRTARPTNGLAVVSLVCALAQFVVVLTFIPAIVCGHVARAQIRRSGEAGGGLALAGLILGYIGGAIVIGLAFLIIAVAAKSGHGSAVHTMPFLRPASAGPASAGTAARPPFPAAGQIAVMPFFKASNGPAHLVGG